MYGCPSFQAAKCAYPWSLICTARSKYVIDVCSGNEHLTAEFVASSFLHSSAGALFPCTLVRPLTRKHSKDGPYEEWVGSNCAHTQTISNCLCSLSPQVCTAPLFCSSVLLLCIICSAVVLICSAVVHKPH